jgi:hypothetical protein
MWNRQKTRSLSTIYFISCLVASPPPAAAQEFTAGLTCDPALASLFTPPQPQMGSYEACRSAAPLVELVRSGWIMETVPPADAFGQAGTYDRARLARLYGGRRATVARGYVQHADHLESITLISPYPDASLSQLQAGTLILVHRVPGV